jgi:hypothetical protein
VLLLEYSLKTPEIVYGGNPVRRTITLAFSLTT